MATSTTTIPTFAEAGTAFNDATTMLVGGVWQNAVSQNGQGTGSINNVLADLTTVQNDLKAEVAAGQFSGSALTHVNSILSMISQEMTAVSSSVNGGAHAAAAVNTIHNGIIDIVQNDPTLLNLATQNGATGFQTPPPGFADGTNAHNAASLTFADIGVIFDDAANKLIGGINASNKAAIKADINTAHDALQDLIQANPDQFTGLTGVHADTIVRQLALEKQFINDVGSNPDAPRALNDNTLDIIDIVQGDDALAHMASQNGVSGWTAFPDKANPTPKFIDTAPQTDFWANFIAQSNSLGDRGQALVGSGDNAAIKTLIADLRTFSDDVSSFDTSQGGIFQARFDNELIGKKSTLGAEVSAMINGLKSGDAVQVSAAAEEMHANAADVGGNNVPISGGAFNTDGRTVAEVLSGSSGTASATTAAPAATPTSTAATTAVDMAAVDPTTHLTGQDAHQTHTQVDAGQHFGHMWG